MNYDISTIENCYNTMEEMTGFQYWEDMFKIYAYRYIDEPDRMKNEVMVNKNIHIKNIDLESINFILLHVTTSANGCKNIKNFLVKFSDRNPRAKNTVQHFTGSELPI